MCCNELRNEFVCIALKEFPSREERKSLFDKIFGLARGTGLPALILIDLDNKTFGDDDKLNDLLALDVAPDKQILFCSHSSHKPPASMFSIKLDDFTLDEHREILKLLGKRKLQPYLYRTDDNPERINLEGYIDQDDGFFVNTEQILKEAKENGPRSWQRNLLNDARGVNVDRLLDIGLWGLEIQELAIVNGRVNNGKVATITSRVFGVKAGEVRVPLLHCGLLLPGSPYEGRAKKVISKTVNVLTRKELQLLKLIVFAALFAPAHGIEATLLQSSADIEVSSNLLGLVSRSIDTSSGNAVHLAIYAERLASLLAQETAIFGSFVPQTEPTSSLISFIQVDLVEILEPDDRRLKLIRQLLLPMLNCAFCVFRAWHSDVFGQQSSKRMPTYSFLVNLLRDQKDTIPSEKAAQIFEKIAGYFCCIRNCDDAEIAYVVSLTTNACRVIADVAKEYQSKHVFTDVWQKEYARAHKLLDELPGAAQSHHQVYDCRGTICKRELGSYCKSITNTNTMMSSTEIQRCSTHFRAGVNAFASAVSKSQCSWANPLIGWVQLCIAMYSHFKQRFEYRLLCNQQCASSCLGHFALENAGETLVVKCCPDFLRDFQDVINANNFSTMAENLHRAKLTTKNIIGLFQIASTQGCMCNEFTKISENCAERIMCQPQPCWWR